MAINLVTKFSPLVDEKFTAESKTSLVTNKDYDFIGADGLKQPNDIKALFKYKLSDDTWQYKANIPTLDDNGAYKPNWVDYSFTIKFPFLYTDTSTLSPKSYKYSMTIYGGNNLTIEDGKIKEDTISYKKPLVDANFIVEADINE